MNTNNFSLLRGSCLLFALSTLMLIPAIVFATDGYVQVRSASLRATPQTWGALVSPLKYGNRVTVLGREGSWLKVKTAAGKQGYVHTSSLTKKKVVISGTKPTFEGGAQSSDLILAGKGYTKEIEEQFKSGDVPLNYAAVDRLEKRTIKESSLFAFRKEGGLD